MSIYSSLLKDKEQGKKSFAVLIDPDKTTGDQCESLAQKSQSAAVDFILVGSSLLTNDTLDECIKILKANCSIPVILFPGNILQVSNHADAILLLSLISGRNAETLIGKHVIAAP